MFVTKVSAYNVYAGEKAQKLVGVSEEVTLPELSLLTETLSGAGILGEIDEPVMGRYGAAEIEIPLRVIDQQAYMLLRQDKAVSLTLRISNQAIEQSDYSADSLPTRIVVKGRNKGVNFGSVKAGSPANASIKVEILYFLYEFKKKKLFELDKLNFVCNVNGRDVLKKVRSQI